MILEYAFETPLLDSADSANYSVNGTVTYPAGKVGNCVSIPGTGGSPGAGDYPYVAEPASFAFGTGAFMYSFWLNDTVLGHNEPILMDDLASNEFYMWTNHNNPPYTGQITVGDSGVIWYTSLANTWQYIEIGRTGTGSGQGFMTINRGAPITFTVSTSFSNGTLFFGESPNHYYHWAGMIDQFRVWSRVLTTDERDYVYNSGTGR